MLAKVPRLQLLHALTQMGPLRSFFKMKLLGHPHKSSRRRRDTAWTTDKTAEAIDFQENWDKTYRIVLAPSYVYNQSWTGTARAPVFCQTPIPVAKPRSGARFHAGAPYAGNQSLALDCPPHRHATKAASKRLLPGACRQARQQTRAHTRVTLISARLRK